MQTTSSKTFGSSWMTFGGCWRVTPGPLYPSRAAAKASLKLLGLADNPAYRIVAVE